jgi:DNA-binding winged helix-turn-helix (wHTH) protein/tetratricopeptide (TPR) repeat protein
MAGTSIRGGVADTVARVIRRDGVKYRLTAKEGALLGYLSDRATKLVSREELLVEVWGYRPGVQTRAVDNTMRRLRGKLERDPRRPTHLLSVYGEGFVFSPLETEVATTSELEPEATSRTIGRAAAIDEVMGALVEHRRVQVTGPPGVGKSQVALEVSHRWKGRSVWVDGAQDDTVLGCIARELGLAPEGPDLARVLEEGRWLVVVDDLRGSGVQTLVSQVARCSRLHVLVTRQVTLPGWSECEIPPLSVADGVALLTERMGGTPVLGDPALVRVVKRLDAIPLALELAAGRVRLLGPKGFLERLNRAPMLSENGLAGAVGSAWDGLSAELQLTLSQLGAFCGGFTLEAAEAVVSDSVLEDLEILVEQRLIRVWDSATGPRFALYAPVREYIRRVRAVSPAVRQRHQRFFSRYGERAFRVRARGWEAGQLLPEIALEVDNLDAAAQVEGEGSDPCCLGLVFALRQLGATERALAVLRRQVATGDSVALMLPLAVFLNDSGHHGEALALLNRGDGPKTGPMAHQRARSLISLGRPSEAIGVARGALEQGPDQHCRGALLLAVAHALHVSGDSASARTWYLQALTHHEATGNRAGAAMVQNNLASLATACGEYQQACERLDGLLASEQAQSDPGLRCLALGNRAHARLELAQVAEARVDINACLRGFERAGRAAEPGLLLVACLVDLGEAKVDMALARVSEWERVLSPTDLPRREALCLCKAEIALYLHDAAEARRWVEASREGELTTMLGPFAERILARATL